MDKFLLGLSLVFIVAYLWYVSLVKKRNTALEALSGIDAQLISRNEFIYRVLEIAGQHKHDELLFKEINELLTTSASAYRMFDPQEVKVHFINAEQLNHKMAKLVANIDDYPDLKSDNTMLEAIQNYSEAESDIANASRFYNLAVSELNTAVEIFPGSIIASMASIKVMPLFELIEVPKVPMDAVDYL
ncbi:LemA family protein [Shewanella putrefaciens]|uniref:LemA family protein n=1 Tax=Shewanella putrefaciens TaxID=24 RepID=A0ABX8XB18_SHEPU|nr:LemA family protein [Shewanella putrefaciens]AVV84645.1 LemA family protein [Shewanella putrefaciens]MCT8943937.1 LemA family protein [Shewanella putrefaciens]QSE49359.1 LemA family protein [Shewanella putrefaciens]QYX72767.1 LemA family protein [Shewanella putrefaciens]GGN26198.1 LemA protein [Shewanella putrefaciens]